MIYSSNWMFTSLWLKYDSDDIRILDDAKVRLNWKIKA